MDCFGLMNALLIAEAVIYMAVVEEAMLKPINVENGKSNTKMLLEIRVFPANLPLIQWEFHLFMNMILY